MHVHDEVGIGMPRGERDQLEAAGAEPIRWRVRTRWVGGLITTSCQSRGGSFPLPVRHALNRGRSYWSRSPAAGDGRRSAPPSPAAKCWLPNVWSKCACVLINACTRAGANQVRWDQLGPLGRGRPAVHHDETVASADHADVDRERFVGTDENASGDLKPLDRRDDFHIRVSPDPRRSGEGHCEQVLQPSPDTPAARSGRLLATAEDGAGSGRKPRMSLTTRAGNSGSGSSRPPAERTRRGKSRRPRSCAAWRSPSRWATSRSGGPHEVSAQSIKPETASSCHEVLPR